MFCTNCRSYNCTCNESILSSKDNTLNFSFSNIFVEPKNDYAKTWSDIVVGKELAPNTYFVPPVYSELGRKCRICAHPGWCNGYTCINP